MRAIVFAYHEMGCVGIEALIAHGYEIVAVVTHADADNENVWFRSVAELAARNGLPVFAPEDVNHPLWLARIRELQPDVLFSFYYRKLLSADLLAIPSAGCFNLHGSLLPKYRGCAPANWAILHGETQTGVTLHYMTQRPGRRRHRVPASRRDRADRRRGHAESQARRRRAAAARRVLCRRSCAAPRRARRRTKPLPRTSGGASPKDGEIDWQQPATDIANLVRAVTKPYPGAFTHARSAKVLVWNAEALPRTVRGRAARHGRERLAARGGVRAGHAQDQLRAAARRRLLRRRAARDRAESRQRACTSRAARRGGRGTRKTRVLILGVNGFIGNFLSERLLAAGGYEVYGMDLNDSAIRRLESHPDFHFLEGDISIHREWLEYHIKKCDVIVPLVAIATPIEYTRNPLARVRARLRREPADRSLLREVRQARDLSVDVRGLRHVRRRGVRRGQVAAHTRPDQQAAVDLLRVEAAARPRDLGVRQTGAAVHAVPAVQLARPAARLARGGSHRQLARDHAADPESRRGHAAAPDRRRPAEALLHGRDRGRRVPVPHHREQGRQVRRPDLQHRQPAQRGQHQGSRRAARRQVRAPPAALALPAVRRHQGDREQVLLRRRLPGRHAPASQHPQRESSARLAARDHARGIGRSHARLLPARSSGRRTAST